MKAGGNSRTLSTVISGNLCAGCGACAAIAPAAVEIETCEAGYLRPALVGSVSPEEDERIAEVCPGLGYRQEPEGRPDHTLWGPCISVLQGHATDPEIRFTASSGGALSGILVHLLEADLVDRIVQVAADPEHPIGNRVVLSSTRSEVLAAAGSRYAPSAPVAGIATLLETTQRHAFVGKPCDVAALRALARFDERVGRSFPYMLSFFCAGVPSLKGAREVLRALDVDEKDISAFRFRGKGWPGFATATGKDGLEKRMSYAESWGEILSRHVQPRCKICPDGTGGLADIVCADAWETDERGYPIFEERDGISLVIGRTQKGEAIIKGAVAAGAISVSSYDQDKLEKMQPGQTQKRRYTLARVLALRCLARPAPRFQGFHLWRNAAGAGVWPNFRNFLGTMRRALKNRL